MQALSLSIRHVRLASCLNNWHSIMMLRMKADSQLERRDLENMLSIHFSSIVLDFTPLRSPRHVCYVHSSILSLPFKLSACILVAISYKCLCLMNSIYSISFQCAMWQLELTTCNSDQLLWNHFWSIDMLHWILQWSCVCSSYSLHIVPFIRS